MKLSKLEKIVAVGAGACALASIFFFRPPKDYTNTKRILESAKPIINNSHITPHIGNFPDTFAVCATAGFVGDYINSMGGGMGNKFLQKVGEYFPEIAAGLTSAYFTLGETILPSILPGRADINDVPLTLVGALSGYTLAKLGRKSGFNEKVYSIIRKVK